MSYAEFRTGLTFADVRREFDVEKAQAIDSGRCLFIGRKTVLHRWGDIKRAMYNYYLQSFEEPECD